ncbi:MAG: hypothetical protein QXH91_09430 [Candidatus Bathyarchaeia archaeon]
MKIIKFLLLIQLCLIGYELAQAVNAEPTNAADVQTAQTLEKATIEEITTKQPATIEGKTILVTEAKEPKAERNPIIFVTAMIIFVLMLLVPFIPSILELKSKEDEPLPIAMDYTKDPRYFGKSFRRVLSIIPELDDYAEGIKTVKMSKEEIIEVKRAQTIFSGESINHIFYVIGDVFSDKNLYFKKELYVKGNAYIGEHNIIRAIACDGNINLGSKSRVIRWMDSTGSIEVGCGSNLGISCSCEQTLKINKDCTFNRLYGKPIVTYNYLESGQKLQEEEIAYQKAVQSSVIRTIEDIASFKVANLTIEPFTTVVKDMVVKKNLYIKEGAIIRASAKVYGETIVDKNSQIYGNIFSEGPITVKEGAVIIGNIFSQDVIHIEKGVRIGTSKNLKSVIGKKGVLLSENVCIYGYVLTEGKGIVR